MIPGKCKCQDGCVLGPRQARKLEREPGIYQCKKCKGVVTLLHASITEKEIEEILSEFRKI